MLGRSDCERTWWQTSLLLNVHTKKGSKIAPKDLALFPCEKEEKKVESDNKGWDIFKAIAVEKK